MGKNEWQIWARRGEIMSDDAHITPNSYLPIVGSVAFLLLAVGAGNWIHGNSIGPFLVVLGGLTLGYMMFAWFSVVIQENRTVFLGDEILDRSMRWSMVWFIFTEVMFFAAFFGVLFYIRAWALPQLSGLVESKIMTHKLLWPSFEASWPLATTPDPVLVKPPGMVMHAAGIPVLNTVILLLSGLTITLSHHLLVKDQIKKALLWLNITVGLGALFLLMQVVEYGHAYANGLTLSSGIYGNIFFMMTGFHGLHVLLGSIMIFIIGLRMRKGHFTADSHFAFEAAAWYWHFVDVVWLALFVFVYWI